MAANKPSIPKGTRDFSPVEMLRRNYIFNTIKEVYQLYGFEQIETPAMENLSTLLGKYGDEGDKLLFKILNSGDFLSKVDKNELGEVDANKLSLKICERGLRYDLTVPFARYVVQHQNDISFPFRRYQIQPVWRADRPQKGRYREFYQCDADIIGSTSLLNELELIQIIDEVFKKLNINVKIKFNNRKILAGIAESCGIADKIIDFTIALDKLDKIGWDKVKEELISKGISQGSINEIRNLTQVIDFNTIQKVEFLKKILLDSDIGKKGIEEVEELLTLLKNLEITNEVELDLTLARGLNYYTGAIFEVKAKDVQIGSICGGGRYDDLTGIFGLKNVSGVGISFGADRIYDVLFQLEKFPQETSESTQILFINFGVKEIQYCLPIVSELRKKGIRTEIFPDSAKMKKQMTYANNKNIPFVALVGENEMKENSVTIKDMKTGDQKVVLKNEIIKYFVFW